MLGRLGLLIGLAATAAALWVLNCSGPRPHATEVALRPPATPDAPYRIAAAIENRGWGHGEVVAAFELHDRATGRTFKETRQIDLDAYETVQAIVDLPAPPGDYTPEVRVEYPPG